MNGLPITNKCMFGVYTHGGPEGVPGGWNGLEKILGKKFPSILWYNDFNQNFNKSNGYIVKDPNNQGKSYQLALMPTIGEKAFVKEIIKGEWDEFLTKWFRQAKRTAKKQNTHFYIRFASEMNGHWTPWGGAQNGGSATGASQYISMWKRVYKIARDLDPNKKFYSFVWSPVPKSYPTYAWNHFDKYYPGDDFVDWVGLSFYTGNDDLGLEYFYSKYTINKPMMISEGGAPISPCGFTKDAPLAGPFIGYLFQLLETHPKIHAFYWFNVKKECEWRFNLDPKVLSYLQSKLKNPKYTETKF